MSEKMLVDPQAVKRMVEDEGMTLGTALIFAAVPVPDEITTLRQQLANSEARVAELIHSLQIEKTSMLMRVSRLSETLEAIRSGEFSLPKCQQLADRALGSPVTEAAILRLQAEAVEVWANDQHLPPDEDLTELGWHAKRIYQRARDHAQRLRQQANNLEQQK